MPLTKPLNSNLPMYLLSWSSPGSPKSGSQNSLEWNLEKKEVPWSEQFKMPPTISLSEDLNLYI